MRDDFAVRVRPYCWRMSSDDTAAQQYDAMASEYTSDNDVGVFNSLYERPAMLNMLGDVSSLRVLDIGCGAGQLTEVLLDRGASVTGIDVSPGMIGIARERLGGRASFEIADLRESLEFQADSFDIGVASLVMHYIEDWVPVLDEIRRVLTRTGSFVFSTHHPTMDWTGSCIAATNTSPRSSPQKLG